MENTTEEQVNEQVEDTQEDGNFNLVDELVSFNKGEESPEEGAVTNEAESDNNEKVEESESQQESTEQWLIDNKFKDNDDGRQKLADSYKSLQSEYDKMRNSPELPQDAQDAIKFAEWVANNDDARTALEGLVNSPEQSIVEIPEDFDQLDIYTEGTSSNDWYKATQNQQRTEMKDQILSEVKSEFQQRDNKVQEEAEARNMYAYLQAEHNMDEAEVTDYLSFIKEEDNFSPQNLVSMYRTSKGTQPRTKTTTKHSESNPSRKELPAGVNAAVGGGSNPPASNNPVDDLMKSLMGNSKRNVFQD